MSRAAMLHCPVPRAPAAPLQATAHGSGDIAVVHAGPTLTIACYTALQLKLLAALLQAGQVDVDLSQVVQIDTEGLQWLVMAKRMAQARQCTLRLRAPSAVVRELLEVSGLALYFAHPQPVPPHAVPATGHGA